MFRRSFIGRAAAAVTALFAGGVSKAAATASPAFDPTVPDRDPHGEPMAWLYRVADDDKAYRIDRKSARPGDRVIMLGLCGDRLFKADSFTVGNRSHATLRDGLEALDVDQSQLFLSLLSPVPTGLPLPESAKFHCWRPTRDGEPHEVGSVCTGCGCYANDPHPDFCDGAAKDVAGG
jgi:hypothetical protein